MELQQLCPKLCPSCTETYKEGASSAALNNAAQAGHVECVKELIASGADVNIYSEHCGGTSLMCAAIGNQIECAKLLLEAGADVNAEYYDERTALEHAVFNRNISCVKFLLQSGAHVKHALVLAVRSLRTECLETLLNAGADVNIIDYGRSALDYAITQNNSGLVRFLVKVGADVNLQSNERTPLMQAAAHNNAEFIRFFLQQNATINERVCKGFNALALHVIVNSAVDKTVAMLLFAAGEILHEPMCAYLNGVTRNCQEVTRLFLPHHVAETDEVYLNLKNMCRKAIREHLLDLDQYSHLFNRIPQLALPRSLASYLLFDVSLDDEED